MVTVLRYVLLSSFLLFSSIIQADTFEANAQYTVCFTPQQNCTQTIVDAINNAVNSIWVQAYSFTSRPIAKALVVANERGVKVNVIFDKSVFSYGQQTLRYFSHNGISIWIDSQPAIAHNKVMILDQTRVITGSFNFTRAAQKQNAENVLLIDDAALAQKYLQNWQYRQSVSTPYFLPTATQQTSWLAEFWHWLVEWFNRWFS